MDKITAQLVAVAVTLATTNAKHIIHYSVLAVFKVKPLRAWLIGNPAEAKQWLALFVAEVDQDIDDLAAAHAAATAPSDAPAAPVAPVAPKAS